MQQRRRKNMDDVESHSMPASTPDARESQMINLADQLAEKQLREGTASAQVITHYLKLGSSRERLEQEKIFYSIELDKAKAKQIEDQEQQLVLFADAIKAMRAYQGGEPEPGSDGDFE